MFQAAAPAITGKAFEERDHQSSQGIKAPGSIIEDDDREVERNLLSLQRRLARARIRGRRPEAGRGIFFEPYGARRWSSSGCV
jgi:hypothetical protein